jgi:hypothetical protein
MNKEQYHKSQISLRNIAINKKLCLEEREKAVLGITDQIILAGIANDPDQDMILRILATGRITDNNILKILDDQRNERLHNAVGRILKNHK